MSTMTQGATNITLAPNTFDIGDIAPIVIRMLRAGLVPMLKGPPGIGKSAIVRSVANTLKLHLIDFRAAQKTPEDFGGYPAADLAAQRLTFLPIDEIPLDDAVLPPGCDGWLLFLDEINSAPQDVQAALYKLVLDRMIGQRHLHPAVRICCAGNLDTDRAVTNPMPTPMRSRLTHLRVSLSLDSFLNHAVSANFHPHIIDYLNFRTDHLHAFNPDEDAETFACPRTWEFMSNYLHTFDEDHTHHTHHTHHTPVLPSIGEAVAIVGSAGAEFISFLSVATALPSLDDINAHPDTAHVPDQAKEPSVLCALAGLLARRATLPGPTYTYLSRLPRTYQILTVRMARRYDNPILRSPEHAAWMAKTKDIFLS